MSHKRRDGGSETGMSLVEVLIALSVGSVLMVGAAALLGAGVPRIHAAGERVRVAMESVDHQQRLIREANSDPESFDWEDLGQGIRRLVEP
jgi:prepilin-type N-terminal cleavage/methylation domain-containing protein